MDFIAQIADFFTEDFRESISKMKRKNCLHRTCSLDQLCNLIKCFKINTYLFQTVAKNLEFVRPMGIDAIFTEGRK